MAMSGWRPIVYSIVKFLGHSHCCGSDDERLMKLIGMPVFDPYRKKTCDFPRLVKAWLADPRSGYIRV